MQSNSIRCRDDMYRSGRSDYGEFFASREIISQPLMPLANPGIPARIPVIPLRSTPPVEAQDTGRFDTSELYSNSSSFRGNSATDDHVELRGVDHRNDRTTNQQTSEPAKMHLADQSEEFTLAVPSPDTNTTTEFVTFRRESLKALMAREDPDQVFDRYYEGYRRCFPDPNEVERKCDLRELLEVGKGDWDISVITQDDRIVAGYHTKLAKLVSYDLGVFSVGDYLWADKSMRGLGLGQTLYNQTMKFRRSQGAQGHFGEIRDVHLLPQKELFRDYKAGIKSEERIGFWKKQSRMALDAPWLQPALSEGQREIDFYMLTISVLEDSCPTAFPREAYLELWGKFYPRHKESQSFESLKQLTADTSLISLLPIDEPRTYIKAVRL